MQVAREVYLATQLGSLGVSAARLPMSAVPGTLVGRTVRNQEALTQRTPDSQMAVAVRKAVSIDPKNLPPPVQSPGSWVPAKTFLATGRNKSFGYFACQGCGKRWVSAHAQRKQVSSTTKSNQDTFFFQQCKACSKATLPMFMWVNAGARQVDSGADGNNKPHEAALCEACRLGKCTVGTGF